MKPSLSWTWLVISLSLSSSQYYFKHKDWQWRDLPSIFDLNKRQDREDWKWSELEDEGGVDKEAFRKSETINKLALGDMKKTSRLAATFNK